MAKRRVGIWAASLAAVCVSASTIPMNEIFARQSSCAPGFQQCQDGGFPDYFCCKSGQYCVPLAGNTTILCCPDGKDCRRIAPLACDVSLQDGQKHPDAVVKTTALGGTLERCGNACCPFGYSCTEQNDCMRDQNQNAAPIQTNTARPEPTRTADPTEPSATGTSATPDVNSPAEDPNATNDSPEDSTSNGGPPVAAIAGGATAGAVVLIGALVLAFIFLRKKDKQEAGSPPKLSRSTSSFGNLISHPIIGENQTLRTDFARGSGPRDPDPSADPDSVTGAVMDTMISPEPQQGTLAAPPAAATTAHGQGQGQAAGGYGYGGPELQAAYVDMPYVDYEGGLALPPQTPQRQQQQQREPSSVSINIFADPNITPDRTPENRQQRRYSNMTTFTQMLDSAGMGGVARGESYVPYGGHDPVADARDR